MRNEILKYFSFLFTLILLSCGGGGGDDGGGGGGGPVDPPTNTPRQVYISSTSKQQDL